MYYGFLFLSNILLFGGFLLIMFYSPLKKKYDKEIESDKENYLKYKEDVETIKILLKSGEVSSISKIQDTIINESLSAPVKKFYICLLKA
jgi:hypothetical protein